MAHSTVPILGTTELLVLVLLLLIVLWGLLKLDTRREKERHARELKDLEDLVRFKPEQARKETVGAGR